MYTLIILENNKKVCTTKKERKRTLNKKWGTANFEMRCNQKDVQHCSTRSYFVDRSRNTLLVVAKSI
jgi:hypothetical protein